METQPQTNRPSSSSSPSFFYAFALLPLLLVTPLAIAVAFLHPVGFDPARLPSDYDFFSPSLAAPAVNNHALSDVERVGDGLLPGPEDFAYDAETRYLYTGCYDGWIKRVKLVGSQETITVENWTFVGGRPLGLAFSPEKTLIVAEPYKGLLLVKGPDDVELLTNEAEGVKIKFADGVDVSGDATIYFTDASYKYSFESNMLDIFEGRPNGRLLSYSPTTRNTTVLLHDLYFANGVALAPDQNSLVFCETPLRRCKRYHIRGAKKGTAEIFVDNLPGFPDNIRYDGQGQYWIALPSGRTMSWNLVMKYPFLRRLMAVFGKYITISDMQRDSGVISVGLEGKPIVHYSDPGMYLVTVGVKIGKYLYLGNLQEPYIGRILLDQNAAAAKPQ